MTQELRTSPFTFSSGAEQMFRVRDLVWVVGLWVVLALEQVQSVPLLTLVLGWWWCRSSTKRLSWRWGWLVAWVAVAYQLPVWVTCLVIGGGFVVGIFLERRLKSRVVLLGWLSGVSLVCGMWAGLSLGHSILSVVASWGFITAGWLLLQWGTWWRAWRQYTRSFLG
jgi:hypothetical protein